MGLDIIWTKFLVAIRLQKGGTALRSTDFDFTRMPYNHDLLCLFHNLVLQCLPSPFLPLDPCWMDEWRFGGGSNGTIMTRCRPIHRASVSLARIQLALGFGFWGSIVRG